ncbi:MAG: DUF1552 domain-containing protein [Myxococcota bacterium]
MSTLPLSRRAFLRGAGGVVVGLPLLASLQPRAARAQTSAPRRFVLLWNGSCQTHGGMDRMPSGPLPATLSRGWAALAPIRQHASVVSSLSLPIYIGTATPPPGGAYNKTHGGTMAPICAGMHSLDHMLVAAGGHTVDQIVADAQGGSTRLPSIQARVQAAGYGYGAAKGILSGRLERGVVRGLDPIFSPTVLYNTIFSGFTPPQNGGPAPMPSLLLRKRKSVLDLVLGDAQRLRARLNGEDRARLDQHFTEIRGLEERLTPPATNPPPATSSCTVPAAPPPDGPINTPANFAGWSEETTRGDRMSELIALALACDLTRAVSWMLTFDQCGLSSQPISGANADIHAISHLQGGTPDNIADNANWHVARYAGLVHRLATIPEGAGTVLDRTCVVYVSAEGNNAHNKSNFTFSYAGCPDVLRPGVLVNAGGAHPAHLMMGALAAMGLPSQSLGEISGGPLSGMMV